MKKNFLNLFYLAGFFTRQFVNKKYIFLHYFHKPEKHLERVGPELNLFLEYYNCMNVRLICFNDYITQVLCLPGHRDIYQPVIHHIYTSAKGSHESLRHRILNNGGHCI